MVVVRIIVKIVLLPVRICLTMIQLVVMFFTWLSATVFHILSGDHLHYSSFRVWIRTGDRHRSGQDACGRFYTLYPACAFWLGSGVAGNNQNQIDEVDHWRKE